MDSRGLTDIEHLSVRYYNYYDRRYYGRNLGELYEHGRSPADNLASCGPHTCGIGAHCTYGSVRPVCSCLPGYSGDPLTQCIKPECLDHSECRGHQTCVNQHCVNPCDGACGINANCDGRTVTGATIWSVVDRLRLNGRRYETEDLFLPQIRTSSRRGYDPMDCCG
ncbi:hypothetical protein EVAR_24313_1 [Eumeta japonica]|uniref:EGF-like domain-containing protein n=1 Tax=Eumeta variegata TaxID=151549 RepID=A0A4C1VL43_EUMVA|nr:hypothetical protein EVAR_24313_1 [Eumeta japonica]